MLLLKITVINFRDIKIKIKYVQKVLKRFIYFFCLIPDLILFNT